jgi:hypothetical protein
VSAGSNQEFLSTATNNADRISRKLFMFGSRVECQNVDVTAGKAMEVDLRKLNNNGINGSVLSHRGCLDNCFVVDRGRVNVHNLSGSKKSTQWRIQCETRREPKSCIIKQEQFSELDLVEPPQDIPPKVSPVILERRER